MSATVSSQRQSQLRSMWAWPTRWAVERARRHGSPSRRRLLAGRGLAGDAGLRRGGQSDDGDKKDDESAKRSDSHVCLLPTDADAPSPADYRSRSRTSNSTLKNWKFPVDGLCFGADERLAGSLEVGFFEIKAAREADAVLPGAELGQVDEARRALEELSPSLEDVEPAGGTLAPLDLEDLARRGIDPGLAAEVPCVRRSGLGFGVDDDDGDVADPVTAGEGKIVAGLDVLAEESDRSEESGAEGDQFEVRSVGVGHDLLLAVLFDLIAHFPDGPLGPDAPVVIDEAAPDLPHGADHERRPEVARGAGPEVVRRAGTRPNDFLGRIELRVDRLADLLAAGQIEGRALEPAAVFGGFRQEDVEKRRSRRGDAPGELLRRGGLGRRESGGKKRDRKTRRSSRRSIG